MAIGKTSSPKNHKLNLWRSVTHNEKAEQLNGRVAMLGIIAALGAYAVTGQIIPGLVNNQAPSGAFLL